MSSIESNLTMSKELATAIEAAKVGAKKALFYFDNEQELGTKLKSDDTPVTIADPVTEKEIKKYILSQFPDAKILGEESGGSIKDESFWIIDPIDGTRVYARGINAWAVLIAYYSKGEFIVGVCYFPSLDELYFAEKGKGAYLQEKKLKVSEIKQINKALLNSGNPKYYKNPQVVLRLIEKCSTLKGFEVTYAHCLVGAGKMEGSIDPYAQLWDFAAFAVIIPEAEGKITNLEGNPLQLTDRGCIITNGVLHKEITDIVSK